MPAASFTQRAIARCVDFALLFLLLAGAFAGFTGSNANNPPWWWAALVLVAVVSFEVVPVHLRGQTPGKILTRIRVVNADDSLPTWRQAFIRWGVPLALFLALSPFVRYVAIPVLAVVYGTALLDRGGRSVLDKLAGTRVVQTG